MNAQWVVGEDWISKSERQMLTQGSRSPLFSSLSKIEGASKTCGSCVPVKPLGPKDHRQSGDPARRL